MTLSPLKRSKVWMIGAAGVALFAVSAYAGPILFRHVLPCVADVVPQVGELLADFDAKTIRFVDSTGEMKNVGNSFERRFPDIRESEQTVDILAAGSTVELSDKNLYQFPANVSLDRIQYSFGFGGVPRLEAGWTYIYAVPDSVTAGQATLAYRQTFSAPAEPSRYLGSFYLESNTACAGDECTDAASLPQSCRDYTTPSTCPQGFGRLKGVPLVKRDHRYDFFIRLMAPTPADAYVDATNLSQAAKRVAFSGTDLSIRTSDGEIPFAVLSQGLTWADVPPGGIQFFGKLVSTWMLSQEEDARLYE